MKKVLTILLIGILLVSPVLAQEVATPTPEVIPEEEVKILPNSPLYFLKKWGEEIQLFLTLNATKKAELQLKLANKRLKEAEKLCQKGKCELGKKLVEKFQTRMEKAVKKAEELKVKGKDVSKLIEKLKENSLRQQEVLAKVLEKVPEEAKNAILKAIENSSSGLERAIEVIQGIRQVEEFRGKLKEKVKKLGPTIKEKIREKLKFTPEEVEEEKPEEEGVEGMPPRPGGPGIREELRRRIEEEGIKLEERRP